MQLGDWELEVHISAGGWRAQRLLSSTPSGGERRASRLVVPFTSPRGQVQLVAIPTKTGTWRLQARVQDRPRLARAARQHARDVPQAVRRTLVRIPGARAAARRVRAATGRVW